MKPKRASREAKINFVASKPNLWARPHSLAVVMKRAGLFSPATKEADIVPGLARIIERAQFYSSFSSSA
jgi:hypothetical protein